MTLQVSTFPASFAQRRLWFIQQFAQRSAAYNMVVSLQLASDVAPARLQRALDRLCMHHEALRTSFAVAAGDVVQRIADSGSVALEVHEVPTRTAFTAVISASASAPFLLDRGPLARAHMARLADSPPLLALVVHHIIADGVTLQILLGDLRALLEAHDGSVQLPQAPVEYADYAVWQRRSLSGKRLETLAGYWRQRLAGMPELALPRRRADGITAGGLRGSVVALRIDPGTSQRLRALAADVKATLFGVLLAGFCTVLGRFSGQRDFGIGIPVSGRNRVELERVAGLFINSVVFRATLPAGASFAALVHEISAALTQDLTRQEMPFEQVVDALRVKRAVDRNPLFQVMLQLQHATGAAAPAAASHSAATDLMDPHHLSAQLDLSMILFDAGERGIEGGVVFAADLFDAAWVEQLAAAFVVLLADAARNPDQPIERLPLLPPPAREALLSLSRGPQHAWPGAPLLHERFAEMARRQPDAMAIRTAHDETSFSALDARAAMLTFRLRRAGLRAGDTLALCSPRSVEAIAVMLATLRCGAAYFCIDPAAPPEYRAFLLQDSAARLVAVPTGEAALACGRAVIELGLVEAAPDDRFSAPPVSPGSAAYLIYTSGSTGEPKGVRVSHHAAVNHMRWFVEQFAVGPEDRVLQRTPLSFDASVWEVWVPLLAGATLVLDESIGPFDPARLSRQVSDHAITLLQVVPSLLRVLLPQARNNQLSSLRLLFCGGEPLSAGLVRDAQSVCAATVVNLYGPSETTIDATFHVCPPIPSGADPAGGDQMAIGRPIANTAAYVLDEHLQQVPWGVIGELCIGGDAVGLGYQERPGLTAERFVADPFQPGGRIFRSGDRARMARDGTLQYLGRNDDQVKLRGFRVELGEVEARLCGHPSVASAAAVVQQPAAGDQRLVAFASLRRGQSDPTGPELLVWLRGILPVHAVPSAVIVLDALPRTLHGKVDRAALRRRTPDRNAIGTTWRAPASAFETAICTCFARVLMVERIGVDDDFFLLGGHSLLIIALCEQLSMELGRSVGVVDVFEFPTPRLLAQALLNRPPITPSLSSLAAARGAA